MNNFRKQIQQTEFKLSAPTFRLCPADIGREVAFAGRSNAGKSSAINALTNQRQLARSSKTPGRTQMINFFTIVGKTEWDGEIDTNINKGKKKLAAINNQRADISNQRADDDIKDDSINSENNETESNDVEDINAENINVENADIESIINTDFDVDVESEMKDEKRLIDLPGYGYASVPEAMKIKWQVELEEYLVSRKSLVGLVLLTDIRHPLKHYDEQMLRWAKDAELPVHILLTKADKLKFGAQKNALLKLRKDLKKLDLPCTVQLFSALKKEGLDDLSNVMGDWLEMDTLETDIDAVELTTSID